VSDPNEFDRALVRSTLALYNELHSDDGKLPLPKFISRVADQSFGWVPGIMEQRARRNCLDPARLRWNREETVEGFLRSDAVLLFTIGAFRGAADEPVTLGDGRRISRERWYSEIIESLDWERRVRVIDGETRDVELPLLTGIEQCIGYAIYVIRRKNLMTLIRPCQFLRRAFAESRAHHYFLAEDPRQKFCSAAHSNAHRQREWRRDHATPRRKK
jgi:hypothetical protein